MNKQPGNSLNLAELRKLAEQRMPVRPDEETDHLMNDELRLLHELQVQQIELELQNENLRAALAKTEKADALAKQSRERYVELFDFAPLAYFILDQDGAIHEANFRGASLLGVERSNLVGRYFANYAAADYRPVFKQFLDTVFCDENKHSRELTLQIGATPCHAVIEVIADKARQTCLMAVTDISERKRNETDLRDSHAFISSILDSLTAQIAVLDRQGVIIAVNNAWIRFGRENGLPEHNRHMLGLNYTDACKNGLGRFFSDEARSAYAGILAVLHGERAMFSLEYACHSDDRQRWFCMTVSPLQGPRYGAVVSHENITRRKLAERMPNLLKALFDVLMDGFLELDMRGNLLSANEAYAKTIGYSSAELIDRPLNQLIANEDADQVAAHFAKAKEQAYDRFETSHRHKDGHSIDVEMVIAFLPEFERFCALCRDISQRKQAEGKLGAIFNASVEGVLTFDIYNNIISANPAVEAIFGYTADELPGSNIAAIMPGLLLCGLGCCCVPGEVKHSTQIFELEGKHKNGGIVPLEVSRTAYKINHVCYLVLIVRDVSLRKQREQQDKIHLDELAHITRLGLMGEMASGIAHEVNQPLTAISSYAQASINLINAENHDPALLADILHKTQQQALRAGQIIHRMREFVESNPKQRSTVELNNVVREAIGLCTDDLKQNSINLSLGLADNLPSVNVDHIQIEQVLINLVRNSMDALRGLPEHQPRHISIQTRLSGDNGIQVRVKDNGPGMDQQQQLKILTPFYTTKNTGMGMGLSISRSLIEAHDGKLYFNSLPGKGSTFYFTLPVRTEKNGHKA